MDRSSADKAREAEASSAKNAASLVHMGGRLVSGCVGSTDTTEQGEKPGARQAGGCGAEGSQHPVCHAQQGQAVVQKAPNPLCVMDSKDNAPSGETQPKARCVGGGGLAWPAQPGLGCAERGVCSQQVTPTGWCTGMSGARLHRANVDRTAG